MCQAGLQPATLCRLWLTAALVLESISYKSGLSLPEVLSASDILVHFSGFRSLTCQFFNLDEDMLGVAQALREKEASFRRLAGTISALYAYQGMNQNQFPGLISNESGCPR